MKNMKRAMTAVLACILLLCSPLTAARARDYSKAEYGNTRWMKMKKDYLGTKTDRLIFVKHEGGTNASVEMWKKVSVTEHNLTAAKGSADRKKSTRAKTKWKKIVSCSAYTGANGLEKERQGDRKTPEGTFNITMAFGRKETPGTSGISYTKLNQYHYWSSEKDTYNQFIDVRTLNRSQMEGEHLMDYSPQYNYALALDYNRKCTYLKGAAIFLHCTGSRNYTQGCIAVPEKIMKKIVRNTTSHTKICIYKK